MKWRRLNHILHRDLGYFCIGLTIIYGISGIVVNHISHDFNPSYSITSKSSRITPLGTGKSMDNAYLASLLNELKIQEPLKNAAMLAPSQVRIFTASHTIDANVESGEVMVEQVRRRPILFEMNYLHLNKGKGVWTYLADLYGVALCLLAVTGLLMLRGRSLKRGMLFTLSGIALPFLYLLWVL